MSAEIVELNPPVLGRFAKVEPDKILAEAAGQLTEVVVIGYAKDGAMYAASSEGPGDALWLLEAAKLYLLNGARED
jgi:hypothetical protein